MLFLLLLVGGNTILIGNPKVAFELVKHLISTYAQCDVCCYEKGHKAVSSLQASGRVALSVSVGCYPEVKFN